MRNFIVALIIVAVATSMLLAQTRAMDKQADMMVQGRPFFTDVSVFNSYDLAGSPLGRFEIDSTSRFGAQLGYGYFSLGDETGHYLSGQRVRMGEPGTAYFELSYGPDLLTHKNAGNTASLPLQRFGAVLAGQAKTGTFRSSLSAEGYVGKQSWKGSDSGRVFLGVERLRIDMGSQLDPFVRIGFHAGANFILDTLYGAAAGREDRSWQMNLPEIGGDIDIGDGEVPVRSNISFTYALSRLVYTSKGAAPAIPPVVDALGNANAIANDSLRFSWLVQGHVPVHEDYMLKPGLLFGYSSNNGQMRVPDEDNHPLKIGDKLPGRTYGLTGIYFGVGTGFEAHKYADLHAEYSLAHMSLELGNYFPTPPPTDKRTLHNVSFGASTQLHKYLELPLEITPRVAYFIYGASGPAGAPHSNLGPMNIVPGKSKRYLYEPNLFLDSFERTSGFTFGLDGKALEDKLLTSFWMTFLSKSTESKGGMELGVSVEFSM